MKQMLNVGLLVLFAAASAQAPDQKRVNAIWDAATDRLTRQTDSWFKSGDYPRSIQLLRIHFELDTSNYDIGTNLGFMLENVEEDDKALAVYVKLRTLNPNDMDDAWPEAYFYFKKKAYAKVPPLLEPTIKGHGPHANLYRTLADAYERMHMFADSKRVWTIYLGKHPEDLAGKAHLGRVEKMLKDGPPKR